MGTGIVGIRQHSTVLFQTWTKPKTAKDSLGSWDGLRASLWGNLCYFGISDPWVVDTTDHLLWVGSQWERCCNDVVWCQAAMFFCNNTWKKTYLSNIFPWCTVQHRGKITTFRQNNKQLPPQQYANDPYNERLLFQKAKSQNLPVHHLFGGLNDLSCSMIRSVLQVRHPAQCI